VAHTGSRGAPRFDRSRLATSERGQAIVLVVAFLGVLLGCAALVVDVGYAYYTKRSLQAQADAAALAGAQKLPNSGAAVSLADQYSGRDGAKNQKDNLPPVTTEAMVKCLEGSPCSPVNAVEVKQTTAVPTQFARILGIDSLSVSARAVAKIVQGTSPWAIFAHDADCGEIGFKYNGNGFNVHGGIRSNGAFEVNGGDETHGISAGYASAGGPEDCEPRVDGKNIDLGGGSEQPDIDPTLHDWPIWFEKSNVPCTFTAAEFKFNQNNKTIPSGVYCATKYFEANGNNQTGTITVIAPEIKIDGNYQTFRPYMNDLLFFATGSKEMILDGDHYNWEGVIFHPGGRIKINGNHDSVLKGLIEGREVHANGDGFNMQGTGPATAGKMIALVE
jgi:hypothetical protein